MAQVQQERILRAVQSPLLLHANLLSRHAKAPAHPGYCERPPKQPWHCHTLLAALHCCGIRMAGHRAAHCMSHLPMSLHGVSQLPVDATIGHAFYGEYGLGQPVRLLHRDMHPVCLHQPGLA